MSEQRNLSFHIAIDGEEIAFFDAKQEWLASWHPASEPVPGGKGHGSAAVCLTDDGDVVLISEGGERWEFPGGRPEKDEDWRATLDREVLEEACATVLDATLLGFVRALCVDGHEKGLALVRSVWRAEVSLHEWSPMHETTHRTLVSPECALERINVPVGLIPVYRRWLQEALSMA